MKRPMIGEFTARLGRLVFDSRQEFEKAVPNYLGLQRHRAVFQIGDTIYFDTRGETIRGQVWSEAPGRGTYWVVGEDGTTYFVGSKRGGWREVYPVTSQGQRTANRTDAA